jgi:hypothetical protein
MLIIREGDVAEALADEADVALSVIGQVSGMCVVPRKVKRELKPVGVVRWKR